MTANARLLVVAALLLGSLSSRTATAKGAAPPRRGFQMSQQIGLSFPAGETTAAAGDALSSRYGFQVQPVLLGVGAKVSDSVYLGPYIDFTFGSKGRDERVKSACIDADADFENDIGCSSYVLRAGLEVRYSITPEKVGNFWLGYGIGPILSSETINDRVSSRRERTEVSGWEFVRLSGGVTFRVSRAFGIGPYLLGTLGKYMRQNTSLNGHVVSRDRIDNRAFHVWTSIGLRLVVFP